MKLITKILTGTIFITTLSGVSACTPANNEPKSVQTNETKPLINEVKAKRIALNELKGGIVREIHLEESKEGNKEYEITIVKKDKRFEVDVNALTGKISEVSQYLPEKNKIKTKVSNQKAREIAIDQVNGRGTISEINLDTYNNRLVYDVEISTVYGREAEVLVDAMTGKVVKYTKRD
ncbi:hypothetical protein AC623_01875 [Bacillus sp. FJAT-27231]|uniref:PepSY domain-containing protein n=1 Tax=Bacillus sp. FJAT-27231 TaxID=1679168 RepID=UPI000670C922|nr:PepSY domain-containing protein [Bacillus sp. FJAT-27231]KMY52882.1 hypothetical protein AC623_01875 [Bacillus sp. FJAT-27231]